MKPGDTPPLPPENAGRDDKTNLPAPIESGRLPRILTGKVSLQSVVRGSGQLAIAPVKALSNWWKRRNQPLPGEPDGAAIRARHPNHSWVLYNSSGDVLMLAQESPLKIARDEGIALDGLVQCRKSLNGRRFSLISLKNADFRAARIHDSDFVEADLTGARFNDAVLSASCFEGAKLVGADFTGVRLSGRTGLDFMDADLKDATFPVDFPFEKCRLTGARLSGIKLVDTDGNVMEGARIGANGTVVFSQAVAADKGALQEQPTPKVRMLQRSQMKRRFPSDHTREDLSGVTLRTHYEPWRNFNDASFAGSTLIDFRSNLSSFRNADFSNAELRYSELRGGDFTGADFRGASFKSSNKGYRVEFQRSDLTGAKFSIDTDFTACDFRGATLDGAELYDRNNKRIEGVHLTSDRAIINIKDGTRLSRGEIQALATRRRLSPTRPDRQPSGPFSGDI
ncbi:MAG: hypothetical protein Alpg2KO_27170 [Alphaproteobacteria bacterium]